MDFTAQRGLLQQREGSVVGAPVVLTEAVDALRAQIGTKELTHVHTYRQRGGLRGKTVCTDCHEERK